MNSADLANMLELMAQALRLMPAGAAPAAQPAGPQRTLSEWLDVHERLLRDRGYAAQTLKNRLANLAHVRRLWGSRPVTALKPKCRKTEAFPPDRFRAAPPQCAACKPSSPQAPPSSSPSR